MFITFEGIDHCGKSTQVKLLENYFINEKGLDVINIREPGGTGISEKIRTILLDKKISDMKIETEILLFSASRAQLVREVIKPGLEQGKVVISDRFHDSTTAYQGYGRGIPLEYINTINSFAIAGCVPDITFIIDIDLETAEERKKSKNSVPDRMEIAGREFFERVRNGYREIARTHKRFVLIDGKDEIGIIKNRIIEEVKKRF
ncbi:MAG: dTMP kinase [Ignavibacteriaceae bacterium]|nr:dTMP kinase [Ignavibacteriaceae bacterium]